MNKITGFLIALAFLAASCENEKKEIPVPEGYQLVWHDEFDYNGLPDAEKWSYDTVGNDYGWGNNELQYYTSRDKDNAFVDGEKLHIKAIKEEKGKRDYTSARLITKNKGDWKYGRFEFRAKLPQGRGIWPAIWMLPTDWEYGDWPASGEIDIMEHVGYNPDSVFASAHTEAYNHVKGTNKTEGIKVRNIYDEFHTYTLEWEEDEYRVFFDDIHFFTFENENKTFKEWPFDKPFHILLNVAVGGNWGGKEGVDDAIFPQEMIVDYVRVYKKK
ncbi:MAG: glycoside hydrolase family 16 protein [Bacteroidales bacterium]|nr:glycoside hydrolase family 16 protein [Bacteroidales bacterium]MCF8336387.1 glycoside hydrolase family 16 protein [Bacteroidales bacterium]